MPQAPPPQEAEALAAKSRRQMDQERRIQAAMQGKAALPPKDHGEARVRVYGSPMGSLAVEVEGRPLLCSGVHVERTFQDNGFLVLRIPLERVESLELRHRRPSRLPPEAATPPEPAAPKATPTAAGVPDAPQPAQPEAKPEAPEAPVPAP